MRIINLLRGIVSDQLLFLAYMISPKYDKEFLLKCLEPYMTKGVS